MAAIIKQQFLQKRKDANLILVLQVIALIFIAILTLFSRDEHQIYSSYFMSSEYYWEVIFQTAVGITLLMDIVYAVLSSYRNEKINLSQTWNLIPVSNAKLWLSNIISTILTCIYLFLLQNVLIFLVALTRLKIKNPLIETLNAWGFWPGDVHDSGAVLFKVLFLLLLAVFVYVMVSFVDFLSKALVDALPVKNTVWIRLLVMAIIAIVIVYFGSMIAGHMTNFLNAHMAHQMKGQVYNDPIWMTDLELLIADLIIGVVNLWLFNKFVEAQINNK